MLYTSTVSLRVASQLHRNKYTSIMSQMLDERVQHLLSEPKKKCNILRSSSVQIINTDKHFLE